VRAGGFATRCSHYSTNEADQILSLVWAAQAKVTGPLELVHEL
jgi:hypothetical protein